MDPLTQGVLGAALPQATRVRRGTRAAGLFGLLGGIAADIDIFIRSQSDPLLFLDYHRHFTHSLVFIPLGGLLCALLFYGLFRRWLQIDFKTAYIFCTLGYATHGLIDACTSYGTKLLWPFSEVRVAFNLVSVIDPLFTVPLLALVIASLVRGRGLYARIGLVWAALYLSLAYVQQQSALDWGREIAAERGDIPLRLEAKPSFGNILVWKVIYESEEAYHVDAVRVGYSPQFFEGTEIAKLDLARDFPWLAESDQQAIDVERFRHFSDDYLAVHPLDASRIIDLRYSLLPHEVDPLWSIALDPQAPVTTHVRYLTHRGEASDRLAVFKQMLFGSGPLLD